MLCDMCLLQLPLILILMDIALSTGEALERNAHIIISGSTDGSITFWDLTITIDQFMQFIRQLQPEEISKSQLRPQTGRGSQGGRWWRSIDHINPSLNSKEKEASERSTKGEGNSSGFRAERDILPVYILSLVHQSGVNCLSVTSLSQNKKELNFCVLSGGDDQAVSCVLFRLTEKNDVDCAGGPRISSLVNGCKLSVLNSCRAQSGHSAAVKGNNHLFLSLSPSLYLFVYLSPSPSQYLSHYFFTFFNC